jgi:hypothetical protein
MLGLGGGGSKLLHEDKPIMTTKNNKKKYFIATRVKMYNKNIKIWGASACSRPIFSIPNPENRFIIAISLISHSKSE